MQKNNKKGFTIVELVIVIAVIAILSGVLISVFTNVIANAKKSAAMQEMEAEWTHYLAADAINAAGNDKSYIAVYEKDGSYYAMAIVNGINASDYVSDEADSIDEVMIKLNEKLKTVNGITFNIFSSDSLSIIIMPQNYKDITEGLTGCSDHVAIYVAGLYFSY